MFKVQTTLRKQLIYRLALCILGLVSIVLLLTCVFLLVNRASSSPPPPLSGSSSSPSGLSVSGLAAAMDSTALVGHLEALFAVAGRNGGNRAAGTGGYNESVAYVLGQLEGTGLEVRVQPFTIASTAALSEPYLALMPTNGGSTPIRVMGSSEFSVMTYAANGVVDAGDVFVVPDPGFGCQAGDYAGAGGMSSPWVALVRRGDCDFHTKAELAAAAGAAAAVVYNQGNEPTRMGVFGGTLGGPVGIPVLGISNMAGEMIAVGAAAGNVALSVRVDMEEVILYTSNIIAETPWGDPDSVVMVGSHLDSVPAGPGINDNGSGTSVNIELAKAVAAGAPGLSRTGSKIRFGWWGGEELGLRGSEAYVASLTPREVAQMTAYLNFDMTGSPNFFRGIYDASTAANVDVGRPSGIIQALFEDFFTAHDLPYHLSPFTGRSDYGPFIDPAVLIPSGGGDTGADEVKTEELRAKFGGIANAQCDTCYHQACDTVDNVNVPVMTQMGQAAAHVLSTLASESPSTLRSRLERPDTIPSSPPPSSIRRVEYSGPRWVHGRLRSTQ